MVDLVLATLSLAVIVVVVCAVGLALTVAPFVRTLDMAEARGLSTARAGAFALGTIAFGLLGALVVYRGDRPNVLAIVPLVVTWAGPMAVSLLEQGQTALGGRAGTHQR